MDQNTPATPSLSKMARMIIGALMCVPFIVLASVRGCKAYNFSRECGEKLELAAEASSAEDAIPELEEAVKYAERHGMTKGSTAIILPSNKERVGFWYKNLKDGLTKLKAVHAQPESPNKGTEESNLLLKLREGLVRHNKTDTEPNVPPGISAFPNNTGYFWGFVVFTILALIGGLIAGVDFEELSRSRSRR